jgi:hypothetical protein
MVAGDFAAKLHFFYKLFAYGATLPAFFARSTRSRFARVSKE